MTKAQLKVLEAVSLRPHTRSELVALAKRSGCHSISRSEFLIDLLHRQGYLDRFTTKANEIRMYRPGERKHEEGRSQTHEAAIDCDR